METKEPTPAETIGWMRPQEAANYCALDRVTLWRAVKRGELRAGGTGRAVRFHKDDLDGFMRSGGYVGEEK